MTKSGSSSADALQDTRALTLNPISLIKDTVETVTYHWANQSLNWPSAIYVTLVHIAGVVGFYEVRDCMWETLLLAFVLWPVT